MRNALKNGALAILRLKVRLLFKSMHLSNIALILMAGAMITPRLHHQYMRHVIGSRVIMITDRKPGMNDESGYAIGTGFYVKAASGKTYLVSNRHVCEGSNNGYMYTFDKAANQYKAIKIVEMYSKDDLCLMEAPGNVSGLELAGDRAKPGDSVWAIGHPDGQPKTVTSGEAVGYSSETIVIGVVGREDFTALDCKYDNEKLVKVPDMRHVAGSIFRKTGRNLPIEDIDDDEMAAAGIDLKKVPKVSVCLETDFSLITTAMIWHGSSGSPLVDDFGHVVGVVYALTDPGMLWGRAITLIDLRSLLSKY